ncbi:MAG: energy-coupling factor transporter transmembrane protein EcfT [Cryobacterium sp.]|nr:energy-coupling factor transporter transmembrane protein EcfT [Cryobacterium sp.]
MINCSWKRSPTARCDCERGHSGHAPTARCDCERGHSGHAPTARCGCERGHRGHAPNTRSGYEGRRDRLRGAIVNIVTPAVTGVFGKVNPVAKLGSALLLAACLILTVDWVSAGTALVLELVLVPFLGIRPKVFWIRTAAVWIAAPLTGLTILLYGRASGTVYWEWLAIRVSDGSIDLAIATALRVLAIGLPAVVLFITIDPTDLADGLAQVWHLPSRFVLGALAGFRLVGLFIEDWRFLELARRARGVGDRGRLRRIPGMVFALLVLAIRRGSRLATAMEARGFGGPIQRTWARESKFGWREWLVLLVGLAIGLIAIAAAVGTGHWNFIVG